MRAVNIEDKRYLAGPYLFWSISFVVIPLLVVFYYAMTNDEAVSLLQTLPRSPHRKI